MADENTDAEDELDVGLERKKLSGKKLVLIAVPVLLLLIGGGVGAFLFLGGSSEAKAGKEAVAEGKAKDEKAEKEAAKPPVEEATVLEFYDLPDMLVNLNTGGSKQTFLKLRVALEVDKASSLDVIEQRLPRVVDNFQIYLRELRLEDLDGSSGMFRLKEELLMRVNRAVSPARVNDVLFKEMLIQ